MQLPSPVRAFVGLIAVAAEEARQLPDRAVELPMLAVSSALQVSLRAQQRYARLTARGDDILNRRPPTEEPPPWATFDEPVSVEEVRTPGAAEPGDGQQARAASQLLDELLGVSENTPGQQPESPDGPAAGNAAAAKHAPAKAPDGKTAPAAGKAPARKAASTPSAAKAARQPAARKRAAKQTGGTGAAPAATDRSGKTINPPRHTAPSRFDAVDDE